MKKKIVYLLSSFVIICLITIGCSGKEETHGYHTWQLVYQNDSNGDPIYGSLEDLINALKRGSSIRVAWGETITSDTSLIEFAQPVFTSVMFAGNDTGVVVQFPVSFIQTSYTDPDEAFLATNPPTAWRALISTEGIYHQFHYNLRTGEITRIMRHRAQVSWFALMPHDRSYQNITYDLIPENDFKLDTLITR